MNIGVTGDFLSGKSTFSKLLAEVLQFSFFSCDTFVHQLYKKKEIQEIMIDNFGKSIYKNGKIQREILSDLVFNSETLLRKLESLILPFVEAEIKKRVLDASENIVFEIPLLYERNLHSLMDVCILLVCSPKTCIKRAGSRGFSKEEYLKRTKFLLNTDKKIEYKPLVIENEGDITQLTEKVKQVATIIQSQQKNH